MFPYHYYICVRRVELRGMCSCTQRAIRALDAEERNGVPSRASRKTSNGYDSVWSAS
jgi:hypothetical protein